VTRKKRSDDTLPKRDDDEDVKQRSDDGSLKRDDDDDG
jgi:hypothetical protein